MLKFLKLKPSKVFLIFYLSTIVFIIAFPLMQHGFIIGHDFEYHLSRIQNIADSLFFGHFPTKIHATSLNGYGYGSGLFYPDMLLYFPAILRLLGLGLSISYKIFLLTIIISIILSTYFSTKYIFKSRYAAIISSILFISSQTVISNIYIRTALGEAIATIFIPIIICGLYNIIYENFSKPWIIFLGFLGLVYSHTITLFLIFIIFSIILLFKYKTFFFSKNFSKTYVVKIFIKLCTLAIIVLLLSISYWLPMLEQFRSIKLNINNSFATSTILNDNALKVYQIFSMSFPGIGLSLIILSLIALLICKFNFNKIPIQIKFIFTGLFLLLLSTKLFMPVWKILNNTIINVIQFPWRILPVSAAFLSLGIGGCINAEFSKKNTRKIGLLIVFALCCIFSINNLNSISQNVGVLPSDICNQKCSIGGGAEWLPLNTDISKFSTPNEVSTENGQIISLYSKRGNEISFDYTSLDTEGSNFFDVPLLFYKGYEASILKLDGTMERLNVVNSPNNNLVRLINDKHLKGKIYVKYCGTALQHISYVVNLIALICVFAYLIFKKYNYYCKHK